MSVIRPERGSIYHRQGLDTLDRRCGFLQQMSPRINAFTPQSVIIRFAAGISPVNNTARRVITQILKTIVVDGDVYIYIYILPELFCSSCQIDSVAREKMLLPGKKL